MAAGWVCGPGRRARSGVGGRARTLANETKIETMAAPTTRLTTPPHPDLEVAIPALARYRRTAVRLHPRTGSPTERDSSLGGPMLTHPDQPWPVCTGDHQTHTPDIGKIVSVAGRPEPMVAGLQLWRRDVPELPFRVGEDLCQVLWCPLMHGPDAEPLVLVRWLDTSVDTDLVTGPVVPFEIALRAWQIPAPCSVSPERIREYPDGFELPGDLWKQVDVWSDAHGYNYPAQLSPAPGTKVGGWLCWSDAAKTPYCAGGHLMSVLVVVASVEYSREDSERMWRPVEEPPGGGRTDAYLPFGDNGELAVFVCDACPDRPITSLVEHY